MSAPDLDDLYAAAVDEALVDDFVRRRFRVEPSADRSGLLGTPPQPALQQPGGAQPQAFPEIHQGPRATVDTDDPQFQAYMRRYFPHAVN